MSFYVKALTGKIPKPELNEKFDDAVDRWHAGSSSVPLHEYLGMPESVYNKIVQDPRNLEALPSQQGVSAEELIAILKTMPPHVKVCYDSGHDFDPGQIEYDEEMNCIHLNR